MEKQKFNVDQFLVLLVTITVCCDVYPAGTIVKVEDYIDDNVKVRLNNDGDYTWKDHDKFRTLKPGNERITAKKLFEASSFSNLAHF